MELSRKWIGFFRIGIELEEGIGNGEEVEVERWLEMALRARIRRLRS